MPNFNDLKASVINRGLCTACGTCIGICPRHSLIFDEQLEEPLLTGTCRDCDLCYLSCPGADVDLPKLQKGIFGAERTPEHEPFGYARQYIAAYASDPKIRSIGASGGFMTAILIYALEKSLIEAALVTTMDPKRPYKAKPLLVRTIDQIMEASASKYVIVPTNSALNWQELRGAKYAAVGVPCQIHGLRKAENLPQMAKRFNNQVFAASIFCGINWSFAGTRHLITETCGLESLEQVKSLKYRGGPQGQDLVLKTMDEREITIPNKVRSAEIRKYRRDRCQICYDFSGELADFGVGDFFDNGQKIPQWSAVIVRSKQAEQLVRQARNAGYIQVETINKDYFYSNVGFNNKKRQAVKNLKEREQNGIVRPKYHCMYDDQDEPQSKCDFSLFTS